MLISLKHSIWQCPFRSLFSLATLSAFGLMFVWLMFLIAGLPLPNVRGGVFVWHAHELLLGFGLAAVAGFTLTAVPEFTKTPKIMPQVSMFMAVVWLLGRITFWSQPVNETIFLYLSAFLHILFIATLMVTIAPRLWHNAERRHTGFMWAIAAVLLCVAGFYWFLLSGGGHSYVRWLKALLGVMQILVIVALSRISMVIVNASIDQSNKKQAPGNVVISAYIARPPKRNMAILCISLFTLSQWLQVTFPALYVVSGWLALAAAAAVLALMGDWHVGKALFRRWPLLLYFVYIFMAVGYGLIALAQLSGWFSVNAGIHMLTVGAMGLSIYMVMVIAGYTHSGMSKERRTWVPFGAACIIMAALLRVVDYFVSTTVMYGAAILWLIAFGLMAWHMIPVWLSKRECW